MTRTDPDRITATKLEPNRAQIVKRYQRGDTNLSIVKHYGCSLSTLRRALKLWKVYVKRSDATGGKYRSSYVYTKLNGPAITTHKLKLKLWKDGRKPRHCENCGYFMIGPSGWPNLQLHHKRGLLTAQKQTDNRLSNLQILCANCHSLTYNWSGRGKKRSTKPAKRVKK